MSNTTPRAARFKTTLPGVGGERRAHTRQKFSAWVHFQPLPGVLEPGWGYTEDISERGVFIRCRIVLPLDSLVCLRICTTRGTALFSARVVHCLEDLGFGCEFIEISEQQRVALRYLLTLKHAAAMDLAAAS